MGPMSADLDIEPDRRNERVRLRILHLPDVVGGHPPALASGERLLGHDSDTLSYRTSPYGYRADRQLVDHESSMLQRWSGKLEAFWQLRQAYDVYHFNFGSSLLHSPRRGLLLPDLPYYGSGSACRFMTFQGCDARLAYPKLLERSMEEEARRTGNTGYIPVPYVTASEVRRRRRVIESCARHCAHIFALNPDLLDFLPPGQSSFLPYAVSSPAPQPGQGTAASGDRPLRIVHLSTSRVLKGTGLIERAVAAAAETVAVSFDLVVQAPRDQALARLARADLLIDQMVLGWYGGVSAEAMWLGVPVICHLDERQLCCATGLDLKPPIINSDLDNLTRTIIHIARNREMLGDAAAAGREFVRQWHDPAAVAKHTLPFYLRSFSQSSSARL